MVKLNNMNQQLIDYIKNQIKLGRSEDVIKAMLKNNGWQEADIEEGFREISGGANPSAPPLPQSAPSGFQPVFSRSIGQTELALPGAGALLKNSWQIYKSRFWTLVGILIIPALIWLIVGGLVSMLGIKSGAEIAGLNLLIIILALILGIVGIFLSVWAGAALFYAVANEITLKEAFQQSWQKRITSFVWVGLLTGLTGLGGFILGVIPSIIFWIWFVVSQFVFIVEEQKGFSALLRSKEYVSGRWWKIFWRMFVFGLVALGVGLVGWGGSISIVLIYKPATSIISYLIDILFGPFMVVYLFSIYNALRQTRPQLANQPVVAKKGFFVFCAILPMLILITVFIIGFVMGIMGSIGY